MTKNISEIMRKVRSEGTTPEIRFRKALWSKGLRYKKAKKTLPGKPDIVFTSKKLAIFIDGDFWHGTQWRLRNLSCLEEQFQNSARREYWLEKITNNIKRDLEVTEKLLNDGWTVLRFWESDIKKNLEYCINLTLNIYNNGSEFTPYSLLPRKTVAEFFAGIGLVRMGLDSQGWSVTFANDNDPKKKEMYQKFFRDPNGLYRTDSILELTSEDISPVSLATASFPCNDLSMAGARRGINNGHSSTFWAFTNILDAMNELKPPIILIENVAGFLTSNKGVDFYAAISELNRLGYSVDTFIIDASHFVPQSRVRLFLVGILSDGLEATRVKEFYLEESELRPKPLLEFITKNPGLDWNIRKLPILPTRELLLEEILDDLPDEAQEWWNNERTQYLFNQMSERHQEIVTRMIEGMDFSYGTVFRRMRNGSSMAEIRTDGIAGCLRTPRGGSAKQILVKAGMGELQARLLTPMECARLMGVNNFVIDVPRDQALFGFGDAVCVPVIEWVAKYYLNPLINELIRNLPLKH